MKPRDEAALMDIARACEMVQVFTHGLTKKQFFEDAKTQSATLHQLMIIGEAVKRLSMEFRDRHPQIPWSLIAGMRDVLIHAYDTVDLDEVWKTATKDIPDLLNYIMPMLPQQPEDDAEKL